MGLKDIVLRYLGQQPPRSDFEDNVPIGQPVSGSVQSYVQSYSYTGEVITPARALEAPSVFACVRLIASSISRLDWSVLRETSDGKVLEPEHPLFNLLNYEPNEDMTAMAFREVMLTNALLTGNAYAYIHRNAAGQPVALEPIRSDYVAMYRDGQNQPYYQVWSGKYTGTDAEKTAKRFRGYDIFHLVGPTMEGILGVPPIHLMRDLIGLELEVSEFVTRFFANGAVPSGTLKMPGRLSPEAAKRLREAWQAAHGGASRAGRVAVLEDGLEYHPITSSFKDNDLIAIRRYCRQQIAAMFQVPAHKIGDTEAGSYNSNEAADAEFCKHTLSSWATRLEQEASRKLIQRGEPYCTRIDFSDLLRTDMSTRFNAYAVAITNGVLTVNEARAREGLKAVDGGDDIRVPLNTEAAAGAGMPPAAAQPVPASEDLEAEEVEPSVDMEPEEVEQQTERARDLLAAAQRTAAIAAVRPAIEAAYRRHLTRVSEYLLKQRTQAKLDKWEPPLECLDADLRDTVAGLGRLLGDEEKATKVLDESLLRHGRAMRRSVTGIANLTETIDGWKTLPGAAAAELLDLVKCEVLNLPYLENTNEQA